jgi:uncharacterized protein (TIGR02678 family)
MTRDTAERQRAFTGLLAHPVLDRWRYPELFALVRNPRHRPVLVDWFKSRLNYDLVVTESAARLFRRPIGNDVVAPQRYAAPGRRVLTLAVLGAAVAEDAEDVTTTQELSDRVRVLTRRDDVGLAVYDADRFIDRSQFVKAVGLLVQAGVLRPVDRDDEDRREGWAHHRDAVGGAYEVVRQLLLRLVDPVALRAALGERGDDLDRAAATDAASRYVVMRRLLELPACLLDDLGDAERTYLANQRHRIVAWCSEMTGWVVEQRAEGLALVASEETDTDLPFPRLRSVDFASLMVLEELRNRADEHGRVTEDQLMQAAAEVRFRHPKALTKELETDIATRDRAVELLRALDLLRPEDGGGWWLSPPSARFRNPSVVSVTARLDENGGP